MSFRCYERRTCNTSGVYEFMKINIKPGEVLQDFEEGVRKQTHYTQFIIQPIEFIMKNNIGYCEGNVIKYVCRWKEKNGIEDLQKAKVYLDFLINKELGKDIV